jgi:hypothetical protein
MLAVLLPCGWWLSALFGIACGAVGAFGTLGVVGVLQRKHPLPSLAPQQAREEHRSPEALPVAPGDEITAEGRVTLSRGPWEVTC